MACKNLPEQRAGVCNDDEQIIGMNELVKLINGQFAALLSRKAGYSGPI